MLNRNQKVERILLLEELDRRSVLKKAGIERERIHRNASDIKDRCRSLAGFIREAWHTIEPSMPYVHGWHIDSLCLPHKTFIETESGPMPIGEIVDTGWEGRVLSANHTTGNLEWRAILRHMKTPTGSITCIGTASGVNFKATGNHPVFVVGKGYVRADTIIVGDRIVELQPLRSAVQASASIHHQAVEGVVVSVEREVRVLGSLYNLEVEGNNNYFANGILLHNCDHLEAVSSGRITRLLVNVPPGTMKSLTISVFWPAWEWGPSGQSSLRYLTTSYSDHYAKRDARRMRDLIESNWYQELWGNEVELVRAGEKSFSNTGFGWREAMPFASLTAGRGDRVIVDDPHSTEKAESEVDRDRITRIFRESLPTRLNSPEHSAIVVIMQRLNEADMSGVIIAGDYGYVYLMLPMEFEVKRRCYTKIKPTHFKSVELEARFDPQGGCWYVEGQDIPEEQEARIKALPLQSVYNQDPRIVDGELLFEKRFPRWVVDRDTKIMGKYASAGQMQQRPAPRGGGMFQKKDFEIVAAAPAGCRWVRAWDLAGSDVEPGKNPAYTAGILMGKSRDGTFYIQDMTRIQGTAGKVDKLLKNTATQDDAAFHNVMGSIPQDPGSAGKDRASYLIKHLAGHNYRKSPESGDKVTRAESMSAQAEAGNIKIVKGDWNENFISEIVVFPVGKFKDQVDAATRAFNILNNEPKRRISLIGGEIFT